MSLSLVMLGLRIALAVCLYGFLTAVLIALWRDLRAAGPERTLPAPAALRRLADDGDAGCSFPLKKSSSLIGRSPSAEVCLPDETVSILHARVWRDGGQWWVEDKGSRNGTFLNEIRVTQKAVLCSADRIRVGRITLEFHAADSPAGRKPDPAAPAAGPPS